jgi:hypothetical protein
MREAILSPVPTWLQYGHPLRALFILFSNGFLSLVLKRTVTSQKNLLFLAQTSIPGQ